MQNDIQRINQGRTFASRPSGPGGFSPTRLAALDKTMAALVEKQETSGIVSLVYRSGEIAHIGTHGCQDIATEKPMARDTIFQIMSMAKPVTAAAALALVDDGKIGLHDPIENYLPEFAGQRVLRTPASELDDTVERERSITLADLLSFRAGISMRMSPNPWAPATPVKLAITDAYENHGNDAEAWLNAVASTPLEVQPGTLWAYGTPSEVVTILIHRVTGMSYADFLQERILGPLGMKDTGYTLSADKEHRLATAYQRNKETSKLDVMNVSFFTEYHPKPELPPFPRGGFGLVSTVDDYLQFARMLLEGGAVDGQRILSRRLASLMVNNYLTDDQRASVPPPVLNSYKGQGWGFGLQVVIDPAVQEQFVGYSSKGTFGFSGALGTWWTADPSEQMIQIFMQQMLSPTDLGRRQLQNGCYDAIEY